MKQIPVVDVFAGPGGLNEGFSSYRPVEFATVASIEMDPVACQTLRLRAAVRQARQMEGGLPRGYVEFLKRRISLDDLIVSAEFAPYWKSAVEEVHQHELALTSRDESDWIIANALGEVFEDDSPWVLIGGPPCQAYSLAGRSRRKHDSSFKDDHKHTLYREYLNIIGRFRPHVFVMENVKGMLSSQHDGGGIFRAICDDLQEPSPGLKYELRSLVVEGDAGSLRPTDYVIKSEQYGIPQSRHRVILLGVRSDIDRGQTEILNRQPPVTVWDAIGDLPQIRSGVSPKRNDHWERWLEAYAVGVAAASGGAATVGVPAQLDLGDEFIEKHRSRMTGALAEWLRQDPPPGVALHASRHHMAGDLSRYAYLATLAEQGLRPRVNELPAELMPKHANALRADAPFADRFRVQVKGGPSSTVTSHIAKDGHYYIHPDPRQMRSLTVREAARLQTFPDNYFFVGNRTQQYHQVGNAVPPYLAVQLADVVAKVLAAV